MEVLWNAVPGSLGEGIPFPKPPKLILALARAFEDRVYLPPIRLWREWGLEEL